ncbi:MAG: glycosyltransferase family 2 protein [Planctomycetota bacterium]
MQIVPVATLTIPPLDAARSRVIVPTFRDWGDAKLTIESLLACRPAPREIVLVDDNGSGTVPSWAQRYPIHLVRYDRNRGPAYARNMGAALITGMRCKWLLFTDTGCARDTDFFAVLSEFSHRQPRSCVAIAGPVHGVVVSRSATPINHYMTEEGILNPPMQDGMPQAIITANAAVSALAFRATGGFDPSYPHAAGEDLDLGLKLRRLGPIAWAEAAVVRHRFDECIDDFEKRFERYGAGNAHLQARWNLGSMRAAAFFSHDPSLQRLADTQVRAMQHGYDRYRLRAELQRNPSGIPKAESG